MCGQSAQVDRKKRAGRLTRRHRLRQSESKIERGFRVTHRVFISSRTTVAAATRFGMGAAPMGMTSMMTTTTMPSRAGTD